MQDLSGRTIAGYQIIEQIGRGGMATVFRAYQPSLDRDVAIKVLPPYYAEQDETFLERFKREARAIAKLRHPNILMVMDFGQEDDLSYIVMEYVTAGTLKDRLKEPIHLNEIYDLTKQIASALQYAHDHGVVHRDVKPSNIMLPKPDWPLLTDFGLARMVGGSFLTQSGMTVGTPAYMSPEQGSGEQVDHRCDIYSLGVMLYEMAVGEVPYTAETPMAVVIKHIVDPLPVPRAKNPSIPEELQKVILKSLAKNPDDRFQQIREIPEALEKIVAAYPDWSAAEMKAVNAVRATHVDEPETKAFDEESLEASLEEDSTVGELPGGQQPAGPAAQEPEPKETVAATAPPVELTPDPGKISQTEIRQEPPQKKRRMWPFIAGGVALLAILGVFIFSMLSNGSNAANNIASNNTLPAAGDQVAADDGAQQGQDLPADEGSLDNETPEQVVQRAVNLLQLGEFDRAGQVLRRVIENNPDLFGVLTAKVEQLDAKGEFKTAAELLRIGLEANPDAPAEHWGWLGWLYLSAEMPAEAYGAFQEAIARDPNQVDFHDGYIDATTWLDNVPDAIGFLEDLKGAHPDVHLIYASLGNLYDYQGQTGLAIENYERALEIEPNDPWVLVNAASVYFYNGDRGRAMELLNRAVEIAPDDPAILGQAGFMYLDLEAYEQAYPVFEKAHQLDKEDPWNAYGYAESIFRTGRDPDMVRPLLEFAEQRGQQEHDPWLMNDIGFLYLEMGDCGSAMRLFTLAEEMAPGETDAQEGMNQCN